MDHLRITVEGKVYDVIVEKIGSETSTSGARPSASVKAAPATAAPAAAAAAPPPASKPVAAAGAGDAVSPLAGIVQAIDAKVGTTVNEGDLVLTLEAMKMFTPINAIASGTITAVHVNVGDAVEEGQVLYTIG